MAHQVIGYHFNTANLCRLAKGMVSGEDFTMFLEALGVLINHFEDRLDRFRIEVIPVSPDDPAAPGEEVNVVFIIWASSKMRPISFKKVKKLPRMQEAKDFLRGVGIAEIDEWKLIRVYLD